MSRHTHRLTALATAYATLCHAVGDNYLKQLFLVNTVGFKEKVKVRGGRQVYLPPTSYPSQEKTQSLPPPLDNLDVVDT